MSATAIGAALSACKSNPPSGTEGPRLLGATVRPYGERFPFETAHRSLDDDRFLETSQTRTPLGESAGILTPSSLHYERHHSGVPQINPAEHRLLIHGMVDRPTIFTMDDLRRFPSVSRIYFLKCSGNGAADWGSKPAATAQMSHGLASCSEWTGVPLSLLLSEAGIQKNAKWIMAEGADAGKMFRGLPLEKAMNDILVAWGQNGEALPPEQGYPVRLFVPGWEGNVSVKRLRRILVSDEPYMGREETSKCTDLMPDGTARQFTFAMEAKSVITYPSGARN